MKVIDTVSNLVDTAIGPVAVTISTVQGFDIDDYVHSTVRAQGIKLQIMQAARTADPRLAKNRPPIDLDGVTLGGY